jgi:hypothetical protein
MRAAAEACPSDGSDEFEAALDDSISRIDQFIIGNEPTTRADLEKRKSIILAQAPKFADFIPRRAR